MNANFNGVASMLVQPAQTNAYKTKPSIFSKGPMVFNSAPYKKNEFKPKIDWPQQISQFKKRDLKDGCDSYFEGVDQANDFSF